MMENWEAVHYDALGSVSRDQGIKYFRSCGISGSHNVMTSEEIDVLNNRLLALIAVILQMKRLTN